MILTSDVKNSKNQRITFSHYRPDITMSAE